MTHSTNTSLEPGNYLFFPIRSNAGWFKDMSTVNQLEARLKLAVFCFDKVILENYRYELIVTEEGAFEAPGAFHKLEDRKFRFDGAGIANVAIGPVNKQGEPDPYGIVTLISGEGLVSYTADFVPVLNPYGLLRSECFGWINQPLPLNVVEQVRNRAREERGGRSIWDAVPFEGFEFGQDYLAKTYYHDMAWVEHLTIPMSLDHRISEFVRLKDIQILESMPDVVPSVYQASLVSGMPDVSLLSWDKLLEVRNTLAAQSYRDMLTRVRSAVLLELYNLKSEHDVNLLASRLHSKELMEEVRQFMPSTPGITFNMALNLVPAIGPGISGAIGVSDYIKSKQSWISLFTKVHAS